VPEKGYGGFLGVRVSDIVDCQRHLRALQGKGISYVKVIGSGVVNRNTGEVEPGGFPEEFLSRIVQDAADLGLSVSAHANGDQAIRSAVKAGVRSVEHGFLMSSETLRMLADRGVYWVPTVYALAGSPPGTAQADGGTLALREVLLTQLVNLSVALEAGVRVALGTDAGSPGIGFGEAVLREMDWWRSAGLSLQQILKAAVLHSAELCGFRRFASFRDGRPLSLVAVYETDGRISARPVLFDGREVGPCREDEPTALGRRLLR